MLDRAEFKRQFNDITAKSRFIPRSLSKKDRTPERPEEFGYGLPRGVRRRIARDLAKRKSG